MRGHYMDEAGADATELKWGLSDNLDKRFNIRLEQDGEEVKAYVNGEEMPDTYPCPDMGEWFTIGAGAGAGHSIEGYFEFIRLSAIN